MHPTDTPSTKPPPSTRLRVWLIVVTILAVIAFIATIPGVLFGTYMAAFAADAPGTSTDAVVNLMFAVWAVGAGFAALQVAGVVGGWIAYRKRRNRMSFGLSLLAAVPILLVVLAIVAVVLMNVLWTLSL